MANQKDKKNLEFRFSLNSFGHCPVQENPAAVASRYDALSSGLGLEKW